MSHSIKRNGGFSLVELIVAMGILGLLTATALPHLDGRRQNINTGVNTLIGTIRMGRAKAMSTGIHYCMHFESSTKYSLRRHTAPVKNVIAPTALPSKVTWRVENYPDQPHFMFNTRGMPITYPGNVVLTNPIEAFVSDSFGITHKIVVWPSGQVYQEY